MCTSALNMVYIDGCAWQKKSEECLMNSKQSVVNTTIVDASSPRSTRSRASSSTSSNSEAILLQTARQLHKDEFIILAHLQQPCSVCLAHFPCPGDIRVVQGALPREHHLSKAHGGSVTFAVDYAVCEACYTSEAHCSDKAPLAIQKAAQDQRLVLKENNMKPPTMLQQDLGNCGVVNHYITCREVCS
jgi:hypothetical protein